jgi:transposase-like protein
MDGATDYTTVLPGDQRDPRNRAVELYRTTDLGVAQIASETGVSRESVYRWLRKEGVAPRRPASDVTADQGAEQLHRFSDEMRELRRDIITLVGQVRRLEGLVEALIGLKAGTA